MEYRHRDVAAYRDWLCSVRAEPRGLICLNRFITSCHGIVPTVLFGSPVQYSEENVFLCTVACLHLQAHAG